MAKPWRPNVDDVDRLSRGDGAKKRGTGSFHIPHRLSADERPVYDSSKKKGYLAVRGTGSRKAHAKHGHPLPNSFRQFCDARAQPCVVIEQDRTGAGVDTVVVDLAPLRLLDCRRVISRCCDLACDLGMRLVPLDERTLEDVPFDVIPVQLPGQQPQGAAGNSSSSSSSSDGGAAAPSGSGKGAGGGVNAGDAGAADLEGDVAAAEASVRSQAEAVRALKASGLSNQDAEVQSGVQNLLNLKERLAQLQQQQQQQQQQLQQHTMAGEGPPAASSGAAGPIHNPDAAAVNGGTQSSSSGGDSGGSSSSSGGGDAPAGATPVRPESLPDDHPYATVAIWQLPPRPLFFEGPRATSKDFAKRVVTEAAAAAKGALR